jgi:hypothetical protein
MFLILLHFIVKKLTHTLLHPAKLRYINMQKMYSGRETEGEKCRCKSLLLP